jgi:hypothetical protein
MGATNPQLSTEPWHPFVNLVAVGHHELAPECSPKLTLDGGSVYQVIPHAAKYFSCRPRRASVPPIVPFLQTVDATLYLP